MGESMIVRRGSTASQTILRTEIITINTNWVMPKCKNNTVSVRAFGGGASGGGFIMVQSCKGGGSGNMNNGEFILDPGTIIPISIGAGGIGYSNAGGTTSFGTYLTASGGSGRSGGSGAAEGGIGYQFGGGMGGSGGIWGGGGGAFVKSRGNYCSAGSGGTYGGGGGGVFYRTAYWSSTNMANALPGNGGTYGGGGGGGANASGQFWTTPTWQNGGAGGTYGGNGGSGGVISNPSDNKGATYLILSNYAQNGTNTIGLLNVPSNCWGDGLRGDINNNWGSLVDGSKHTWIISGAGGGGYGGRGGMGGITDIINDWSAGGGGGGYGGNGGNATYFWSNSYSHSTWTNLYVSPHGGGGGGGYGQGADGGEGNYYGGGGGGYFSKGGSNAGGGGGYYCNGVSDGGGGSAYGYGANSTQSAWGGGGGWGDGDVTTYINGGNGICILQYWI